MVIDLILDRKDDIKDGLTNNYSAKEFYLNVMQYGQYSIASALDGGTEPDVKKALCDYIDRNEYNPAIKDFINSVQWVSDDDLPLWSLPF